MKFNTRDKSILVGLYLSKFYENGLAALGFDGIREAFNVIGYAIGSKPASIKNYRDEFDPYFPNPRKGWHKRPIREYCKNYLEEYSRLNFETFTSLIKSFLIDNYELENFIAKVEKKDFSPTIEKRLITGFAAEEYFKCNYQSIETFREYSITDTTKKACGFDFKLDLSTNFYCIEVKGLNSLKGSVSLTEKEFSVAQNLKEKYCLFIVSNFIEAPKHQFHFDPLNSELYFTEVERQVIQRTYTTQI